MNPIDLLPVDFPLTDKNPPSEDDFYRKVLKELLPDILYMQNEGIPIDLEKVKEIEELTSEVLKDVDNKLVNNPVIQEFLSKVVYKNISAEFDEKYKTYKDYLTEFMKSNEVHRTYVVNYYLEKHGLNEDKMNKWNTNDIRQYANLKDIDLFKDIVNRKISNDELNKYDFIQEAMLSLAHYKAKLYNKNIEAKKELQKQKYKFNPNSSTQIRKLMNYLGYESEGQTKKGQAQWDRANLLKLKERLERELENYDSNS